ncbi:hypothetical protein RQP46_010394 [Phenoliferia psychrophenolica]
MLAHSTVITLSLISAINAIHIPNARFGKVHRGMRREVPQEHSHEQFLTTTRASLNLNNPGGIQDVVFGLLGNAAATTGANGIDPDCLQQATADQAFTNAKAAGDVAGMTAALVYAALERNTGSVGLASVLCTSVTAVNPEIAAITRHQDPASTGAAAINKASTLGLAVQIAAIGGDPQTALKAGTFAPGTIGDPTAAGNTCDDQNDATGCIFTQGDVTVTVTDTITVTDTGAAATATASGASATASTSSDNLQTFTGDVGGSLPPDLTVGGRGFVVTGSDDFVGKGAALQRSCDIQHNACANAANSGGAFTVGDCDTQDTACSAAISA